MPNPRRRCCIIRENPLQKRFFGLCQQHLDSEDKKVRVLASALFQHCDRLFAFIELAGVEPTNNSAERALRHAVIRRKGSFGNQSRKGEIATARLLRDSDCSWGANSRPWRTYSSSIF